MPAGNVDEPGSCGNCMTTPSSSSVSLLEEVNIPLKMSGVLGGCVGGGGGGKSGLLSGGVSTNESDYELVENSIAEVGCIVNMENKLWQINRSHTGLRNIGTI